MIPQSVATHKGLMEVLHRRHRRRGSNRSALQCALLAVDECLRVKFFIETTEFSS